MFDSRVLTLSISRSARNTTRHSQCAHRNTLRYQVLLLLLSNNCKSSLRHQSIMLSSTRSSSSYVDFVRGQCTPHTSYCNQGQTGSQRGTVSKGEVVSSRLVLPTPAPAPSTDDLVKKQMPAQDSSTLPKFILGSVVLQSTSDKTAQPEKPRLQHVESSTPHGSVQRSYKRSSKDDRHKARWETMYARTSAPVEKDVLMNKAYRVAKDDYVFEHMYAGIQRGSFWQDEWSSSNYD